MLVKWCSVLKMTPSSGTAANFNPWLDYAHMYKTKCILVHSSAAVMALLTSSVQALNIYHYFVYTFVHTSSSTGHLIVIKPGRSTALAFTFPLLQIQCRQNTQPQQEQSLTSCITINTDGCLFYQCTTLWLLNANKSVQSSSPQTTFLSKRTKPKHWIISTTL